MSDPDIQALRKANRRPLWTGLGVVAGSVITCALWALEGAGAVRSELEADGHTDVDVTITAPFEYHYTSKKDAVSCGGTFTRLPFSTSHSEGCYGTTGARPRPARPENEVLAEALRTQFPALPVVGAQCPKVDPGAIELTCTLESDAGAPLEVVVVKDGRDWKIKSPKYILSRATLADSLTDELRQKTKAHQVVVDCGAGLFGHAGAERLTCSTTRERVKGAGRVEITFAVDGSYTWEATGI